MRILKLLNKISLSIIFLILLLATKVIAEETPVDIWNIDKTRFSIPNGKCYLYRLERDFPTQD